MDSWREWWSNQRDLANFPIITMSIAAMEKLHICETLTDSRYLRYFDIASLPAVYHNFVTLIFQCDVSFDIRKKIQDRLQHINIHLRG